MTSLDDLLARVGHENLHPESLDDDLDLVYRRCLKVFQHRNLVEAWLTTTNHVLGDVTPLSLLTTKSGIEMVLDELGRIKHGIPV
jgi:putative toxin-antitoxin system antitoxin component (TIGR02293 family)